ncbi:hypothetical protein V2J09_011142 [Rumex salicifolius]
MRQLNQCGTEIDELAKSGANFTVAIIDEADLVPTFLAASVDGLREEAGIYSSVAAAAAIRPSNGFILRTIVAVLMPILQFWDRYLSPVIFEPVREGVREHVTFEP